MEKTFFSPVCSKQEIDRIFAVNDASDYLLKIRAETIVDHMRLFRVYRNKALAVGNDWSLEASFDSSHYQRFLESIDPDVRSVCQSVTFGNVFSNDPNGSIAATEYGRIISISDSLSFFLKFMHLALLDFCGEVPQRVRMNAMRIALRVMLKTEAMDFLVDPRGIVPAEIGIAIHEPIPFQMQFIAGHEFAHHVLGHLSDANLVERPTFFAISPDDKDYKPRNFYNKSQLEELDADYHALSLPNYSEEIAKNMLESVLIWLGGMEIYEMLCDTVCPKSPWDYRSHPKARDRYENLLLKTETPLDFSVSDWKHFPDAIEFWKKLVQEDLGQNYELYEFYGSVYLDTPNTEWRGPELKDRVDYY